jgi:hypothetical protein
MAGFRIFCTDMALSHLSKCALAVVIVKLVVLCSISVWWQDLGQKTGIQQELVFHIQ